MCIPVQDMKFPLSSPWSRSMATCSSDANDNDDTLWTIHDYIGSLAFMPNEPIKKRPPENYFEKSTQIPCTLMYTRHSVHLE